MVRRVLLACCLLPAAFILSCSHHETPVEAGLREKILHVGNGAEPESLDPQVVNAYTDQRLLAALFEGLCAIDEQTSQPAPGAAERWESSADG
ncbi:MAG: oppA 1, partial [Lacunisphaera sp.]|nr:oppA 1 [Lacunisphaera sp.]